MKKIIILGGGFSKERAISLVTAKSVLKALKKKKYNAIICEPDGKLIEKIKSFKPNVVFNALHGRFGEDGYIQTVLETAKVKYTHSGVMASSIAINKKLTKEILSKNGIAFPKPITLKTGKYLLPLNYNKSFVIKPNTEGSSIGVKIIPEKLTDSGIS